MLVTSKPFADLLNAQCALPRRIMCFTLPLRMIRVVAQDESMMTFRVEQLVLTNKDRLNPKGTWTTLSTHGGQAFMGTYMLALEHAVKAQSELHRKLVRRAEQRKLLVPA